MEYIIKFYKGDQLNAELRVVDCAMGKDATLSHYIDHAKKFMQYVRFDRATIERAA